MFPTKKKRKDDMYTKMKSGEMKRIFPGAWADFPFFRGRRDVFHTRKKGKEDMYAKMKR